VSSFSGRTYSKINWGVLSYLSTPSIYLSINFLLSEDGIATNTLKHIGLYQSVDFLEWKYSKYDIYSVLHFYLFFLFNFDPSLMNDLLLLLE
jgi:hypothetical protein